MHSENLSTCGYYGQHNNTFYNAGKESEDGISVVFTDTVSKIPWRLFACDAQNYARVKEVSIGSKVSTIQLNAFENCYDLEKVIFEGTSELQSIDNAAFCNCGALSSIELPRSVTNIGADSFLGCKNLQTLGIRNKNCTIYNSANTLGIPADTVLKGYKGSTTQTYAKKYGYTFIPYKDVFRLRGKDRYETAFLTANALKDEMGAEKFNTIIVTYGGNFPDALSGTYLAAQKDAPILLTNGKNLTKLKNYIRDNLNKGGTLYLLGARNVVSASLESGMSGYKVVRLGGATRYETNLSILKEAGVKGKDILVCTGRGYADSLSASATGLPILLVKDSLTSAQKNFLKTANGKIYVIGGAAAVSKNVENALKTYGSVKRIGGTTRYETSVLVAKQFFKNPESAVLAYSKNFPDGLCGGALAYNMNSPLILTAGGNEKTAMQYTSGMDIENGYVLGGVGLIPDTSVRKIFNLSSGKKIELFVD